MKEIIVKNENKNLENVLDFQEEYSVKFIFYVITIFVLFIVYGYLQELIFQLEGFKSYGFYLTLYQFFLYVLFSFCERMIKKETCRKIPLKMYVLLSILTVTTMGCSNASVGYLNYPTQVVFKCCKLIPVLVGRILIQGKIHSFWDFIAATFMSIGLILFTLADNKVYPNFNFTGMFLISLALVADALIGNVQEKTLNQYSASNSEMVFYSYAFGFFYLLFSLTLVGQLKVAIQFCSQHVLKVYGYGFLFSFTGYCGVNLVLTMVKLYGAFTTVTVTTCRKALTIILSFLLFSKPFTLQYLWSGMLIVCGIYINIYSKNFQYNVMSSYFKKQWNRVRCRQSQKFLHPIEV